MLAQFVLIVFAFFAVLSLVIDVGYARMTQAQMQNAADAAALEGLRMRDAGGDPAVSDTERRMAANRFVHWTFDDDGDTANGDPDYQFGAGPIIDLTEGFGELHALQTMSVPDVHVYKPDLQLNQQNEIYGDQVSGRFCYSADPAPSEAEGHGQAGAMVCDTPQTASGPYARNDFNPGVDNSAFLVRLRRSNEFQDVSGQLEPDVASSGPSLPLIFGKGALIRGDDPLFAYSPRRDGLTIRATAIADTRPALRVGLPQPAHPGVVPFALVDTFVQSLTVTGSPVTINPATGNICTGPPCVGANPANVVGRFVGSLTDPTRRRWTTISTVGLLRPAAAAAGALLNPAAGYGPVYSLMASGTNRIIGFAPVTLTCTGTCPAGAALFSAMVSRGPSAVAPSNATAILFGGLPLPADAQTAELTELVDKNLARNGRIDYGPVLVPVLAR